MGIITSLLIGREATLATRKSERNHHRLDEIEEEIANVTTQRDDDETKRVLRVLDELRKQGIGRSSYNLQSSYGQGIAPCESVRKN